MNAPSSPYQDSGRLRTGGPMVDSAQAQHYKTEAALTTRVREAIRQAHADDPDALFEALKDLPMGPHGPVPPRFGAKYLPRVPALGRASEPQEEVFSEDTPAAEWHHHCGVFCQEAVQVLLERCRGRKSVFYPLATSWLRELPFPEFAARVLGGATE